MKSQTTNNEIDLSWGEPFCIRENLNIFYNEKALDNNIENMLYSPVEGNPELVNLIRDFIEKYTGLYYKHIIVTNGTTGAVNAVLRSYKKLGKNECYTRSNFFPYYPDIIKKNGYKHLKNLESTCGLVTSKKESLVLLDSPSNPEGESLFNPSSDFIIWDSVYHNPVYINKKAIIPNHRVNCGSFSKVLGITGARVGWIATNNDDDYEKFKYDSLYENSGISSISQDLVIDILNKIDMDDFLEACKISININRNYLEKLSYLFGDKKVPENGMFYSVEANKYCIGLLNKANVKVVDLGQVGSNRLIRFNLAQKNELTRQAVNRIIRLDKVT